LTVDSENQKPARNLFGRRRLSLLLVAAVVIGGSGALTPPIFRSIGGVLVATDALEVADVIIVPGWTHESGALEAADLYKRGIASRVAVLGPAPEPSRRELIRRGVVAIGDPWVVSLMRRLGVQTIEVIPGYSTGTDADGKLIASWLEQNQLRSAVLVATSEHTRRVRRMLQRALKDKTTTVLVVSARFSKYEPDRWWKTRAGVRTTVIELQKLLLDVVTHPFG
jgi:uncharacterized SAM-binding protein YcdF (DUF218 family)